MAITVSDESAARAELRRLIGRNIVRARSLAGLSQRELGDSIGVSRYRVSAWENGHRQPGARHLEALATVLGQSRSFFLADNEGEAADDH